MQIFLLFSIKENSPLWHIITLKMSRKITQCNLIGSCNNHVTVITVQLWLQFTSALLS